MSKTRKAVVDLVTSWLGLNENDGSYKKIIDIYNSYKGKFPRGIKMQYDWAWCACTWSAVAIKLGYTDIMPIEISCGKLIEAAKKMGCWQESDSYVPKPGDAILYDWDDNGIGENTAAPDHVGIVTDVTGGYITVIEGNYANSVKKRKIAVNGRYIRGFVTPNYDKESTTSDDVKTESKPNIYLPLLKKGSTGKIVKTLQILLKGYGYSCGAIDGEFGANTYTAVKTFQQKNNLTSDGEVGQLTWNKLLK